MGTLVQVPRARIFPFAAAVTLFAVGCSSSTNGGSNGGGSKGGGSNSGPNTAAEKCTNGIDDDGDGRTDCADDDCSAGLNCNKSCVPAQVDLSNTLPVAVHDTLKNTSGTALRNLCRTSSSAAERTYLWTAPDNGTFVFDTFGSGRPSIFALINPICPASSFTCAATGTSNQRSLSMSLRKGQPIVIVISIDESANTSTSGNDEYDLHINAKANAETRCFDLADEDGDGRIDCDDPDCRDADECAGFGCVDEKLGDALPVDHSGTLRDERNHFGGSCGGSRQKERVISWTAPASGEYIFDATGTQFTATMYLRRGSCTGTEIACAAERYSNTYAPTVRAQVAADETILIILDGSNTLNAFDDGADYHLRVWKVEAEICNDGLDNDGNGAVDGNDFACSSSTP